MGPTAQANSEPAEKRASFGNTLSSEKLMVDCISLRPGYGEDSTMVCERPVDIEPVVNAGGPFALSDRAGKGEEKRRDALFKFKPSGDVYEVIKHR